MADRRAGAFQRLILPRGKVDLGRLGVSDPTTEAPVVRHLPGLQKARHGLPHDTAQPLIAQLPSYRSRPRSVRAMRRDRKPHSRRRRVAQLRTHPVCVKAGHAHALDHARHGALTVEWKDRLP
jgi:hypothetical protein